MGSNTPTAAPGTPAGSAPATAAAPVPAAPAPPLPLGRLAAVGAVVFFANAALLVLQLVASRLLAPFVGSSLETWTGIIGVFLTGIALGNALGGKLADRYPSPRTLAVLLLAGVVAALWMVALPVLLESTGAYKAVPLGPRIPLLALLLCLPAGFVLSLLTPLAIKLGLPDVSKTGRVAGLIFALSTLGCLVGNYVTGFYLIPNYTINVLVYASAGVLGVMGVGTFLAHAATQGSAQSPDSETAGAGWTLPQSPVATPEAPVDEPADPNAGQRRTTAILATAGLLAVVIALDYATNNPLQGFLLGWLLIFLVALWAVFDSVQLEMHKYEGRWGGGRLGVFLGILVLWPVMLPLYLIARSRRIDGTLKLKTTEGEPGSGVTNPYAFPDIRTAYAVVFLASLGGMTLELTASRVLAQFVGVSLFTWTGIIGVMLAGTACGNFLGGVIADRVNRPTSGVNPRAALAATLISGGGATVLILLLISIFTQSVFVAEGAMMQKDLIAQVVITSFSMFFLPMFILGMVSPQVIRLSVPDVAHAGRVAGRVYAWSTAGAIVGTFAAGYVLISAFGMHKTLLLVSFVLTGTSLLVARVWENNTMLYLFSIVLGGVTGGLILKVRSAGEEGVVAVVETNYYTIKVETEIDEYGRQLRRLTLDHLVHSSVDLNDPGYLHYEHEHVQMDFLRGARAASPNPRVLVIGGGGYTFPRYAMLMLPETRMDVVEIDPGVTKVARQYLGLKDIDGLNIVHMDGRQFVAEKVESGTYDLVIQDAVNDLSVPSHLMTKEYNDAVKRALKPGGVYLLTVIDAVDEYGKLWKAAVHTLQETYPPENVRLLSSEPRPTHARQVYVIYASDRPLDLTDLRSAARDQLHEAEGGAAAASTVSGAAATVGFGGTPHAIAAAAAGPSVRDRAVPFHTHEVSPEFLKPYLEAPPKIVLTDQFAPVDNLMADVFRYRYRRPAPKE